MQTPARRGSMGAAGGVAAVLALAWAGAGGCDVDGESVPPQEGRDTEPFPDDPPTAQRATHEGLLAERDRVRDPADQGSRAWIEGEATAVAGAAGSWTILVEVGERGIEEGGAVRFMVPPYWHWSRPQAEEPGAPGYTTIGTEAEGVSLVASTLDQQSVLAVVQGRGLERGETLRIVYGAGRAGARADRFAEAASPFWIWIDGNGDGTSSVVTEAPTVEVRAAAPARLVVHGPSTAHVGDEVFLRVAVLDRFGNTGVDFAGSVDFPGVPEGVEVPEEVTLAPEDRGRRAVPIRVTQAGVVRLLARALPADAPPEAEGWLAESNPLEVSDKAPRILWGDLHGHSVLTDGTGSPEDFYTYAREVARLDVAVLTDHDHWGLPTPLDATPSMWEHIAAATRDAHAEGEFVTLLGYEWTNWIHGHRHVLYFEDAGEVLSALDERYDTPTDLWRGLRAQGVPAMTFAHHSAGGPVATNWEFLPDPEFEPLTEVSSVHGSSEAMDSPGRIYSPLPGNFVRDILDRGVRFGFVGSGDSHDGHPGLTQLAGPNSGLAAILAEEATREAVEAALRSRRCYATSGPRIILRAALAGHRMGAAFPAPEEGSESLLFVHAIGTAPLRSIQVIRSGAVVQEVDCQGAWDFTFGEDLAGLSAGEYVYVRVVQEDRGLAWSSPFYVE